MKRLKGLYKDSLEIDQPQGTYRHAENINLNDEIGSISCEQGNKLDYSDIDFVTGNPGFTPLAYETTPDGRLVIWYVNDGTSGIGIYDGAFTSALEDSKLNFTKTSNLSTTLRLNKEGEVVAYWTDDVNPPKTYNLDTRPSYSDIRELNLFDFIEDIGRVDLQSVISTGGGLYSGAYMFAIRYEDDEGNKSNFFDITRPISIVLGDGSTTEGTTTVRTSKSIRLSLTNLDQSYAYVEVAVIRFEGETIAETNLLPKVVISDTNGTIIYTGQAPGIPTSVEEIVINKVSYNTARTITQLDDVLYMANLTRSAEIDYQTYANNIVTEVVEKEISGVGADSWSNPETVYFSKSFRRGEVYAFYISFVLDDGTETEAFHIPGRVAEGSELDTVNANNLGDFASGAREFQIFAREGTNGFAYWENAGQAERYPDNDKFDVTDIDSNGDDVPAGSIRGEQVRHHRFPDEFDRPIVADSGFNYTNYETMATNALGVKFSNVKIPPSIRDQVKGVKFYYAEKNTGNRINLDEGFGIPQYLSPSSDWDAVTEADVWRNEFITDPKSANYRAISVLPFSFLRNKNQVTGVDYMIRNRQVQTSYVKRDTDRDFIWYAGDTVEPGDKELARADANYIQAVEQIAYYDSNVPIVTVSNLQFEYNKSSYLENSGILVQTPFGDTISDTVGVDAFDLAVGSSDNRQTPCGHIWTLCSFRTIIHENFAQQTLIQMGSVDTNISRYDPTSVAYTGETSDIYSGDTFISKIGHLVSCDRGVDNDRLDQVMIHTLVQSYDHVEWRQAGEGEFEFNPNVLNSSSEILDYYRRTPDTEFFDNYYAYDDAHSIQSEIKSTVPDQSVDVQSKSIPTRVIRSAEQNPQSREDAFRVFLENDYLDLPSNRGEIMRLARNNNVLIVHAEKALFRTRGKEELATGDFRAFLGSGDIFEIQPSEIFNTKNGFAGIQDVDSAVETKAGYFFVDTYSRTPYLLSDKIMDLTEQGMIKFFRDNLKWFIDEVQDHHSIPFVGITSEYDEIYDRILLTKVDYEPTQSLIDNGTFNDTTGKFEVSGSPVEYSDTDYFTDKSFTISYLPQIGAWVSFHSYMPLFYMNNGYDLYSIVEDDIYIHNSDDVDYCSFYGTQEEMAFQFVQNNEPTLSKKLVNLELITKKVNRSTGIDNSSTISAFRVRNERQDSTKQTVVNFPSAGSNARNVEGTWRINNLRDVSNYSGGSITWQEKKRFIDKYALIDLYYNNAGDTKLSLISAVANFKRSIR